MITDIQTQVAALIQQAFDLGAASTSNGDAVAAAVKAEQERILAAETAAIQADVSKLEADVAAAAGPNA